MKGSLDNPPIILQGRRRRAVVVFAISLVLMLTTAIEIPIKALSTIALEGMVLWAIAALVTGWQAVRPSRLEISPDGLTMKVLWRTRRYGWEHIHDFRPCSVGLYTRTVGFDYVSPPAKGRRIRQINAGLAGVHGTLSTGWALKPHELADLLNDARERWLDRQALPGDPPPTARTVAPPRSSPGFVGARMRRLPYALMTVLLLAMNAVLILKSGPVDGARFAFVGFTVYFTARRLHDIGHSGWWQMGIHGAALVLALMLALVAQRSSTPAAAAVAVIEGGFFLFLCLRRGDPGANRFGPAPGQRSPLAASEPFR